MLPIVTRDNFRFMPFVKLDVGILDSSLWVERDQRDLFITALCMAVPYYLPEDTEELETQGDKGTGFIIPAGWYGIVRASSLGIIGRSRLDHGDIAIEDLVSELEQLAQPDLWSRSVEFGGRRMVRISGGFIILNFAHYREIDRTAAERQQRYREKQNVTRNKRNVTGLKRHAVTQAEAEAEAVSTKESHPKIHTKEETELYLSAEPPKKENQGLSKPKDWEEFWGFITIDLGLTTDDARYLWNNWKANGFTRNGKAIKDWKAAARAWKAGKFYPSQKVK